MRLTPESTASGTAALRKANSQSILAALRVGGSMGRRDIAKLTRLSFPTVCRVVNELISGGVITEVGTVSVGSAKRKTALLSINPGGGWVAALDLGGSRIKAAAMDLSGRIRESIELPIENSQGEESVTPAIYSALNGLASKAKRLGGAPKTVGISSSGIVDAQTGVVKLSFNLQLHDFSIARVTREIYNVPTVVRHDVWASTFAEAKLGNGRESPDFAYITVGIGVGAGLVFGGQVKELSPDAEFGLMVVASEGDPERFGGRGYLESMASGRGIAAAARRELEAGAKSIISDLSSGGLVTAKTVAEAARQGDNLAQTIMARAAHYLGLGIVNLAHTLGLTLFVLGGGVPMAGEVFWGPLRETIEKYEYWPGRIRVEPSDLGNDAAILGAGMLALDKALETLA